MVRNPISVLWLGQNKMTMRKYIPIKSWRGNSYSHWAVVTLIILHQIENFS